jgi:hypothetical protein
MVRPIWAIASSFEAISREASAEFRLLLRTPKISKEEKQGKTRKDKERQARYSHF